MRCGFCKAFQILGYNLPTMQEFPIDGWEWGGGSKPANNYNNNNNFNYGNNRPGINTKPRSYYHINYNNGMQSNTVPEPETVPNRLAPPTRQPYTNNVPVPEVEEKKMEFEELQDMLMQMAAQVNHLYEIEMSKAQQKKRKIPKKNEMEEIHGTKENKPHKQFIITDEDMAAI